MFSSVYKKIIKSNLADNFYIRAHFDHEADGPIGLNFTRGEVFRVVDTMHRGKLGNWLAIRMGNNLHEMDKGTIPNQARSVGGKNTKCYMCFMQHLFNSVAGLLQGRDAGKHWTGTASNWRATGNWTKSRVLEITGTERK